MADGSRPTDRIPILDANGKVAHYGFTGTQQGMTREQFEALLLEIPRGGWWHHGDCIGADKQSHDAKGE